MLGFIADVHVGNHKVHEGTYTLSMNERCRQIIAVLKDAADAVADAGGDTLVIGGDLFDTATPTPQMGAAVAEALEDIRVIAILGNHERVSGRLGDHAIGWLGHIDGVQVLEEPEIVMLGDCGVGYMVPFQEGDPKGWLPGVLDEMTAMVDCRSWRDQRRSLYIHLGLRGPVERTNKWAAEAKDAIDIEFLAELCLAHRIANVFAGNWHTYQQHIFDSVVLTQVGALVPTGYDNPGLEGYGGVALFDSSGCVDRIEIPGPRFVKSNCCLDDGWFVITDMCKDLYVSFSCKPEDVQAAEAHLEGELEAGHIKAYKIEIDHTEAAKKARVAARSARDADTIDDALDVYIASLKMPEGVESHDVQTRCRKFLDLGGTII